MTHTSRFRVVWGFVLGVLASASGAAAPLVVDAFSPELLPAKGLLEFAPNPTQPELIEMGVVSGFYGIGMHLKREWIPAEVGIAGNPSVIQIGLGTVPSKAQGLLPQFATLTLVLPRIPSGLLEIKVGPPPPGDKSGRPVALILMASPRATQPRSDEEKLKGTYFAQSGIAALTPRDIPQPVQIQSSNARYRYRRQWFKLEIDAKLATPFNPQEATLRGGIEIPVYFSEDKEADSLAQRFLKESFGTERGDEERRLLKPARKITSNLPDSNPRVKRKPTKPRARDEAGMR